KSVHCQLISDLSEGLKDEQRNDVPVGQQRPDGAGGSARAGRAGRQEAGEESRPESRQGQERREEGCQESREEGREEGRQESAQGQEEISSRHRTRRRRDGAGVVFLEEGM